MSTISCLYLAGNKLNLQPMVDESKELAARLRIALDATKDVNQAKLAEVVGVSEQAVGKWLRTGKIARERIPVIARALNISLEWFLLGVGAMRAEPPLSKEAIDIARAWENLPHGQRIMIRAAIHATEEHDKGQVDPQDPPPARSA